MEENDQITDLIRITYHPEAVILGGGDFPSHPIPLELVRKTKHLVCCDGSVNQCMDEDLSPWRVVGDGDSISTEARKMYADRIRTNPDQETNDQTKAVEYLRQKGIRRVAIVGATGRREDHTLGNISLLMEYFKEGLEARIYTDYGVFIPCGNDTRFTCPLGSAVSIFSFGTEGMTSEGLAYPLYDFNAWWQGTLNHTISEQFEIHCKGNYLVYIAYENIKERK